jgi:hypothetical protein
MPPSGPTCKRGERKVPTADEGCLPVKSFNLLQSLAGAPALAQEAGIEDEALIQDARIYARMYGVDTAEAARRIKLMVSAQGAVTEQEAAEGEALVAGYFDHKGEFKYVIETQAAGKAKKALQIGIRGKAEEKASLPVEYRNSARASRASIRKIFREKNNAIDRLFPDPRSSATTKGAASSASPSRLALFRRTRRPRRSSLRTSSRWL